MPSWNEGKVDIYKGLFSRDRLDKMLVLSFGLSSITKTPIEESKRCTFNHVRHPFSMCNSHLDLNFSAIADTCIVNIYRKNNFIDIVGLSNKYSAKEILKKKLCTNNPHRKKKLRISNLKIFCEDVWIKEALNWRSRPGTKLKERRAYYWEPAKQQATAMLMWPTCLHYH